MSFSLRPKNPLQHSMLALIRSMKKLKLRNPDFTALVPDIPLLNLCLSQLFFFKCHGRFANISQPQDLNDHIYRFKISPHAAIYGFFVDKLLVKRMIKSMLDEKYVIPTLAIIQTKEELEQFSYAGDYIIKPTHMSGLTHIQPSGRLPQNVINRCSAWLKSDLYKHTRENNYRFLEPQLIIEPILYLNGHLPLNYRFYVIQGKCELIQVNSDRHSGHFINLYDSTFKKLEAHLDGTDNFDHELPKPQHLPEMIDIAEKLGGMFDFARIDLYETDEGIKFGEITFTPGNASNLFEPYDLNRQLGQLLENPADN